MYIRSKYHFIILKGDNKLYLDFTKKSLNLLKDNGYLLFITPKNTINYLLNVDKKRNYIDNFYKIEYLALDTPKKYFNIGSTFCYFLLKKEIINNNKYFQFSLKYFFKFTYILLIINSPLYRIW